MLPGIQASIVLATASAVRFAVHGHRGIFSLLRSMAMLPGQPQGIFFSAFFLTFFGSTRCFLPLLRQIPLHLFYYGDRILWQCPRQAPRPSQNLSSTSFAFSLISLIAPSAHWEYTKPQPLHFRSSMKTISLFIYYQITIDFLLIRILVIFNKLIMVKYSRL